MDEELEIAWGKVQDFSVAREVFVAIEKAKETGKKRVIFHIDSESKASQFDAVYVYECLDKLEEDCRDNFQRVKPNSEAKFVQLSNVEAYIKEFREKLKKM